MLAVFFICAVLQVDDAERSTFITSAIYGLLTFLLIDVLGNVLDRTGETMSDAAKGGLGAFLYLEVLDTSFSFDGVIGAFALTQNLLVIAIGLGIGAMYVRSMTIMLVERGTLAEYRYLEHGGLLRHPDPVRDHVCSGDRPRPRGADRACGATIIGIALWSSIRFNRAAAAGAS